MESADETTDLWRPSKAIWSNELRLKLWLKFQKNWEKLRTIMRAEDIKNKLNEEFNKFKN